MTRLGCMFGGIVNLVVLLIILGAIYIGRWQFSPQIAYLRQYGKIHLMDIDRRLAFPLVNGLTDVPVNLSWSPNGQYLTYVLLTIDEGYVLYVFDIYTHERRRITTLDSDALLATWSPDSRQLAHVPQVGLLCIYTVASSQHTCYPLDISRPPDWSPHRPEIAILAPTSPHIALFDPISTQITPWVDAPDIGVMANLHWSHDGTALVFTQSGMDIIADLYWVSVPTAQAQTNPVASQLVTGSVFGVNWSPDDQWLAYQSVRDEINLSLYAFADGREYALTDDSASKGSVEWSPDGTSLIYISDRRGFPEVYMQPFDPLLDDLFPSPAIPLDITVSMYGVAVRPNASP